LSDVHQKHMISSIVARYFFFYFYGFCPFKFKETLFGILINFRVAFLDSVARADKLCSAVQYMLIE
jgi:hypothetical protein